MSVPTFPKRQNSIVQAISAVTAALRLESIPNPTDEQLRQIHDAKVNAANIIDDSNFVTAGEHGDDAIETAHQVDAVFEQAGIDPVQLRRDGAVAGAVATVAAIEAGEQAGEQAGELDEPEPEPEPEAVEQD